MCRVLVVVPLCWLGLGVPVPAAPPRAQEPAAEKLKKLADDSRARAEAIAVSVAAGGQPTKAKVHPTPLMKYTDVPRHIEMATLWVWENNGRPVALGKVEAYQRKGDPRWLFCFASASAGLVEGRWPTGQRFRARKPGVEWVTLKGPAPHETAAGRLRQMKELFQRFTATTSDEVLKTSDELRPLARPLHEYTSPKNGVVQAVMCGFAANGTNPDVVVLIEAVGDGNEKGTPESWRYAVVGMTASGISVKLDKNEVYTRPYARSPGDAEAWTYFWEDGLQK